MVLSIRYTVICNKSPAEQDAAYNEIARKIHSGEYQRASHVKAASEFKKLYPSDDEFAQMFETKQMATKQSKKKVRYLLLAIEKQLSGKKLDSTGLTVEHIPKLLQSAEFWQRDFAELYRSRESHIKGYGEGENGTAQ